MCVMIFPIGHTTINGIIVGLYHKKLTFVNKRLSILTVRCTGADLGIFIGGGGPIFRKKYNKQKKKKKMEKGGGGLFQYIFCTSTVEICRPDVFSTQKDI